MNNLLFLIVIFALILHFLFTDHSDKKDIGELNASLIFDKVEQNLSTENLNLDLDDNESAIISTFEPDFNTQISQNEANLSGDQSALDADDEDDDLSLSSILPTLKEMIAKLKPSDIVDTPKPRRKKSLFPKITQNDVLVLPQIAENGYFDLNSLPQSPDLSKKDLRFRGTNLAKRLFEPNENGKILWQNGQNWELWKKNVPQMRKIYTLLGGFYLYKSENGRGFLSDEIYISLQKTAANAYFLAISTPKSYANYALLDFTSVGDYFIFKAEKNFIIAYLFNRDFTKWWKCTPNFKCNAISANDEFSIFSSDTNSLEMRLSEGLISQ